MLGPRAMAIVSACAAEFDLTAKQVLAKPRSCSSTRARHLAWYLIGRLLHKSNVEIGKLTGFDHSSVRHGIGEIEYWVHQYPAEAEPVLRRIGSRIDWEQDELPKAAE